MVENDVLESVDEVLGSGLYGSVPKKVTDKAKEILLQVQGFSVSEVETLLSLIKTVAFSKATL